ncbi:MAG: hypothetical protein U1E65_19850 [Myxococcota bacterium]
MRALLGLSLFCLILAGVGCSDDAVTMDASTAADAGGRADGAAGMDSGPDCFQNPHTSLEIINACTSTTVQRIDKHPNLPLRYADGGLPPLH